MTDSKQEALNVFEELSFLNEKKMKYLFVLFFILIKRKFMHIFSKRFV